MIAMLKKDNAPAMVVIPLKRAGRHHIYLSVSSAPEIGVPANARSSEHLHDQRYLLVSLTY